MSGIFKKFAMLVLGASVFVGDYGWDGNVSSVGNAAFITQAHARVGRPATPVSYAGVARRTTRRTVAATSAAVAAQPVVVAAPPPTTVVVTTPTTQTCVDTVNPDGTVTRVCK